MTRIHAVQDQRRALQEMCQAAFGDQAPAVDVYDGDTAKVGFQGVMAFPCSAFVKSRLLTVTRKQLITTAAWLSVGVA